MRLENQAIDEAQGWQKLGNHLLRFEPPDIFVSRSNGDVSRQDMEETFEMMQRQIDQTGPIFWISNVVALGRVSPESRKVQGPRGRTHRAEDLRGLAIVGASFHQRVLVMLGVNASRLLRRDSHRPTIAFFETEEDARVWIAGLRGA